MYVYVCVYMIYISTCGWTHLWSISTNTYIYICVGIYGHLKSSPEPLIAGQILKETTSWLFNHEPKTVNSRQHAHKHHSASKYIPHLDELVPHIPPWSQVCPATGVAAPRVVRNGDHGWKPQVNVVFMNWGVVQSFICQNDKFKSIKGTPSNLSIFLELRNWLRDGSCSSKCKSTYKLDALLVLYRATKMSA